MFIGMSKTHAESEEVEQKRKCVYMYMYAGKQSEEVRAAKSLGPEAMAVQRIRHDVGRSFNESFARQFVFDPDVC
jgi:hypothetical protein